MKNISGILFCITFGVIGAILIIGSWKKWPTLTDPPTENGQWISSSFSFIKKFAGKEGLLYINYLFGTLFILLSLFLLVKEIFK